MTQATVIRAEPGKPWPEPPYGGRWVRTPQTGDLTLRAATVRADAQQRSAQRQAAQQAQAQADAAAAPAEAGPDNTLSPQE